MSVSKDPLIISGMVENNAPHEVRVRNFLSTIVREPQTHARFMNMLSMLEHVGSRKIMMSQMNKHDTLDQDTLQHLAEEAQHAYFFKRHAERIAGRELKGWVDENTMCRVPALMYFGRMDAGISKNVAPAESYPWVSLVIELRACWLYHMYNEVIEEAGIHLPLKSLIAQEDHHLAEMYEMCGGQDEKLRELSAYETGLFATLWDYLEQSLELKQAA
jgi:hypothetical protein